MLQRLEKKREVVPYVFSEIVATVWQLSGNILFWSDYRVLIQVEDKISRDRYVKEDANVIILMENRIVKHQNIEFEWFLKARKIFTNKVKGFFCFSMRIVCVQN